MGGAVTVHYYLHGDTIGCFRNRRKGAEYLYLVGVTIGKTMELLMRTRYIVVVGDNLEWFFKSTRWISMASRKNHE